MPAIMQTKYRLSDVIKRQGADLLAEALLRTFLQKVESNLKAQGRYIAIRTHLRGVTALSSSRKAFMLMDLTRCGFSVVFFTGKGQIPGLAKANWLCAGDNAGAERYRVTNRPELNKAVGFAMRAWELADRHAA